MTDGFEQFMSWVTRQHEGAEGQEGQGDHLTRGQEGSDASEYIVPDDPAFNVLETQERTAAERYLEKTGIGTGESDFDPQASGGDADDSEGKPLFREG